MKFREMRLQINRVTVDAPLGEGVTVASLTDAIRVALESRTLGGSPELPAASSQSPEVALAGAIAGSIAERTGAMNAYSAGTARGGGNERR